MCSSTRTACDSDMSSLMRLHEGEERKHKKHKGVVSE